MSCPDPSRSPPKQRSLTVRLAALAAHAKHPADVRLAAARRTNSTFVNYWLDPVCTEHSDLDDAETCRLASLRHREHMTRLALASSRARAARKTAGR